jgi:ribosomal protein L29
MRIKEIRDMDKSELTEEERLELRKELKDIKDEAHQTHYRCLP